MSFLKINVVRVSIRKTKIECNKTFILLHSIRLFSQTLRFSFINRLYLENKCIVESYYETERMLKMNEHQAEICGLCKKETHNYIIRNVSGKETVICEDCHKEYFDDH